MNFYETPDASELPDLIVTAAGVPAANQLVTTANVKWLVDELGVRPRLDMLSHDLVLVHEEIGPSRKKQALGLAHIEDMAQRVRLKNLDRVRELLGVLAMEDPFHPFEDYLTGLAWDGQDHLGALAATITTQTGLWPVYLRRWLVQVCEAACGWREERARSLPHVLVFAGDQGLGKATWFGRLFEALPEAFLADAQLHLDRSTGKDDQLSVLSHLVAELAEIDASFKKSDVGAMKSFLSRTTDRLRAPYARQADIRLRGTVFCGSVNETEFLLDKTGSRRFWPVAVEAISWDHGVDMAQVWAQAFALWCDGEEYWLTPEENQARVVEAEAFDHVYNEEELLAAHFHDNAGERRFPLTRTEIMLLLDLGRSPAVGANVTRWLTKHHGKYRKIQGKKRSWMVPLGPVHLQKVPVPEAYRYLEGVTDDE